ncbi:MAG: response regulator [Chloroflexi bacterium]|nr:response regulator [Chloroflexota bacterium]
MPRIALVADDDTHSLFFMESVLQPTGMQVLVAEDGLKALEILQRLTPDVVFIDLLMPRLSGLDVIGYIMETRRLQDVAVVIVTAHDRSQFMHYPQLTRADAYLLKPVRTQDIRDIAQQVAGGS